MGAGGITSGGTVDRSAGRTMVPDLDGESPRAVLGKRYRGGNININQTAETLDRGGIITRSVFMGNAPAFGARTVHHRQFLSRALATHALKVKRPPTLCRCARRAALRASTCMA